MIQVLESLNQDQIVFIKRYLKENFHQQDELNTYIEEVSNYYEAELAPYYVGLEQKSITGLLILDDVEEEMVYGRIFTKSFNFLDEIRKIFRNTDIDSLLLETPEELPGHSNLHFDYAEYMMALSAEKRKQTLSEQNEWISNQEKRVSLVPVAKEDRDFYESILEIQYDMEEEEAKERFDSLIDEDAMHGFIIYADCKDRVGIGSCYEGESFITLFDLTILPEYQGLGYGKGMILRLLSDSLGKNKKHLLQVTSSNLPAFQLYQKLGFEIIEQQLFYDLEIS
ncbi:MAG: GNAT family N-acetyltransferase [Clostridiales bacterium]|nr:GNAT family N-acetyltransferase [Clostridiales bacterium]